MSSQPTLEPLSENGAVARISRETRSVSSIGAPPLAKASNCWVRPARTEAVLRPSASRVSSSNMPNILAIERFVGIAVRMLLKSCAMPPARIPRDSSL